MLFHLLSSSWLLRACTGIDGKVYVPSLMAWWQFEKGTAGWILLFVLVADWIWSNSACWLLIGDTVLATMPYPTSKIRQASRVVEDPLLHPRFYRSWLAEIGLRSLWSFSSHWFIKVHRRHQSRVPGCLSTKRLMSQSRQVTPNLWRTPNKSLPIWWWSVASSAVGRRCGCWVLGVTAQHGGVTAGDGNTVDSVAWCEHVTHYVHT